MTASLRNGIRPSLSIARPILSSVALVALLATQAQVLPSEWNIDAGIHRLAIGSQAVSGFYAQGAIREIDLQFSQPNYWELLLANAPTNTRMPATVVVDGVTYPNAGVRLKGTATPEIEQTLKWSFDIDMNFYVADQQVGGYTSIILDNASNDASFMRQVLFSELVRSMVPVEKANFVHLTLNGEDWGLYVNIQETNSPYLEEWFFTNNGSLWHAERPDGQDIGTNGDGTAALNYLGPDTTTYQTYYTLERSEQVQPWDHLVRVADKLNNTPLANLRDSLDKYLDVDRTLWFLATEIAFSDRTSYVRKGKDDYLLYQESESDRMTPLQLDGRTTMRPNEVAWSAFYNANDVNYPLLNRMLAVPSLRQRYLAHLRTIIDEKLVTASFNTLLATQSALIDGNVQSDPRKLYTYLEFQQDQIALQEYVAARRLFLLTDAEVAQQAPTITQVDHRVNGTLWADAFADQSADVRATVTSTNGISAVRLHYCHGLHGKFTAVPMFDDGLHNDGAAGDGTYGAAIPPTPAATRVRYYIEAAANNTAQSVRYAPRGAEHDVYTYQVVHPEVPQVTVRINELMAENNGTVTDNVGDFDDWIEFYNLTGESIDLTGYRLSDDGLNLAKWTFPGGSVIPANGYLIIWADDDLGQGSAHANFQLSSSGEAVWLSTPQGLVMDFIEFGEQIADMGLARVPNGTGPFIIQPPTFNANNNTVGVAELEHATDFTLFPNPATGFVDLLSERPLDVVVFDAVGRRMAEERITGAARFDVSGWPAGTYYVRAGTQVRPFVVIH